jgi:hypothetical protein
MPDTPALQIPFSRLTNLRADPAIVSSLNANRERSTLFEHEPPPIHQNLRCRERSVLGRPDSRNWLADEEIQDRAHGLRLVGQ